MFCNESMYNQFEEDFELNYTHGYSYTELNEMMPWEREVIISMLRRRLEEKRRKANAKQS